jgi:hypothetical protein
MDEDDTEHTQYYILADLVYMRKNGMSVEEFLDRIIALFEMKRKLPELSEFGEIELSKVEDMMIYIISLSHHEMGNDEIAMAYLQGLMKNSFKSKTEYMRTRCKRESTSFAEILKKNKEYEKAEKCMSYVMEKILNHSDSRIMFDALLIQLEIFREKHNKKGAKRINDFLTASDQLVNYLYMYYEGVR